MAHATQLSSTEQDTLVKQIGLALLRAAPRDWKRITAGYRTVGRYHELDGEITLADGSVTKWVATHDIATLFGRLRAGMYREERGTWFNARYQLDAPASYNLEYDREEPNWNLLPPSQAYADELRMFPRTEENVPDWLMRRLAGLGPERPGPRFRIARVFDGTGQSGRPIINRPELDVEEQDRILAYLGGAPVVLPGRGYDIDRLSATPDPAVPVAFHSDGTWIWPAAVNFYLQEYGVSPEQDLIEHIRASSYEVPEVGEDKRAAANGYLTQGNTAPQPAAPAGPSMPTRVNFPASVAAPGSANDVAEPAGKHSANRLDVLEPTQAWHPPTGFRPPGEAEPAHEAREDTPAEPSGPAPADQAGPSTVSTQYFDINSDERDDEYERAREDVSAPAGEAPGNDEGAPSAIERMRAKLDELGVPPTEYRIGGPTKLGWSLEEVPEGWRVGWYEDSLTNPSVFGDADDAAAFMLGKLLLEPSGNSTSKHSGRSSGEPDDFGGDFDTRYAEQPPRGVGDALAPEPFQAPLRPEPSPSPTTFHNQVSRPPSSGAPSQPGSWPIQPLPGEPPLTLFRGKQLEDLPAGSELDRFGGPEGNLTYAAGTPFEERSLVPEWVNRPYHVYRVQRPIEALSGIAIPWFNQPGGGSAYLLPASIEELLTDGVLIELDPGEPPID